MIHRDRWFQRRFFKPLCVSVNPKTSFYNFRQNDTEEFINLFMDFLHQSIKKRIEIEIQGPVVSQYDKLAYKAMNSWSQFFKNDYSYIVKKFYSQLFSISVLH